MTDLMKPLILGSESSRRKEILNFFTYPFLVIPSYFDESSISFTGNASSFVTKIAEEKALTLAKEHPKEIILTADTTVYQKGKVFGKPQNLSEAFQMLSALSGSWHSVFTGVALMYQGHLWSAFEETRLLFNLLTVEEIKNYHRKFDYSDKAGGYTIQGGGGLLIKTIEGCYYNVMGLPLNTVKQLLLNVDVNLWDYLK